MPTFTAPIPPEGETPDGPPDSPPPAEETPRRPSPEGLTGQARRIVDGVIGRGSDQEVAPTATSTTGDDKPVKVSQSEVTALVIGVLALVVTVAGGLTRWQLRRNLRRPTRAQEQRIAAPIGRIMLRRVDMARLGPDIGDALQAAAALGEYISDGPLLQPIAVDPGVPADVNQEES